MLLSTMAVLCALAPQLLAAASLDLRPGGNWRMERRGTAEFAGNSVSLDRRMLVWEGEEYSDFELRCRARIADAATDGALWLRFRYRSDNEHYALALRGSPVDDLFLFRFGREGTDRLLAIEPLDFTPAPGKWYGLRVRCVAGEMQVFVNNESRPRLRAVDPQPIASGLIGIGGGYRPAEYSRIVVEPLATIPGASSTSAEGADASSVGPPVTDERREEAGRQRRRAARRGRYQPARLPRPTAGRQVFSLDGVWLFLPDQEMAEGRDPRDPRRDDGRWHTIEVPEFWTPTRWWMYGPGEGTSDNWVQQEDARVADLTFDQSRTHAGWYRHWIHIPRSYVGKRLALHFDAVAMGCQVWLNGQHVGGNVGMFAPFEIELPEEHLRFDARNLITVLVVDGAYRGVGGSNGVLGAELTAVMTREMLDDLPRGMYGRSAGIWQPVRLVATSPLHIRDVHFRPALDGFDAEVDVAGPGVEGAGLRAAITEPSGGAMVAQATTNVQAEGGEGAGLLSAHGLAPRLWTPDAPYLYELCTELIAADGSVVDSDTRKVGFRTFEAKGKRLLLNGRPYWLRGANHAPSGLRPNSAQLARAFTRRMHEGNTVFLRAHGSSFTETWLRACDEQGVGVSLEGIWPWVMSRDVPPPADELLEIWESEWLGVMRKLRNHPSLLMWTLNNESYWHRATDPELRRRKWGIVTRLIGAMRELDPARPIVCDSGYVRNPDLFRSEIEPNGFDDGDIDDAHMYYGWYWPAPWRLYPEQPRVPDAPPPLERVLGGARPAISQEFSTGYPNNDTGHPTRKYIDRHSVAQAWVGDYAYEDRDPAIFLSRHAWLTKELAELARRHRRDLCGLLLFCNSNWFRTAYAPELGDPYPAYEAARTALSPVLVSADLRQRRFYAGDTLTFDAYIVNDAADGADLAPATIEAELRTAGGSPLAKSGAQVAAVPYYGNCSVGMSLRVPGPLPASARAEYELALRVKVGERQVSENAYPLVGATREWAGTAKAVAAAAEGLHAGEGGTLVATGPGGVQELRARPELQQFIEGGGRVLVMNAGQAATGLLPDAIQSVADWQPEVVNVEDETSPLLDGLEPWDVCWLNSRGGVPVAATGGFRVADAPEVNVLAAAIRPHGYLKAPAEVTQHSAAVVFEIRLGKGKAIVSEINSAAAETDPVAARLVCNLLRYLASGGDQSPSTAKPGSSIGTTSAPSS